MHYCKENKRNKVSRRCRRSQAFLSSSAELRAIRVFLGLWLCLYHAIMHEFFNYCEVWLDSGCLAELHGARLQTSQPVGVLPTRWDVWHNNPFTSTLSPAFMITGRH